MQCRDKDTGSNKIIAEKTVKEKWTYPRKMCLCVPGMQKRKWLV